MNLPEPIPIDANLIGLLSDSHGDARTTRAAVRLLLEKGAEALLHLGDVCSDAVLDELVVASPSGERVPARTLIGNMDLDARSFRREAEAIGVPVDDPVGCYRAGGRLLVAQHGHHRGVEEAARRAGADLYLHGHSHRVRDDVVDGLRILNPGALHRAPRHTVGLLDVRSLEFSVLEISRDGER